MQRSVAGKMVLKVQWITMTLSAGVQGEQIFLFLGPQVEDTTINRKSRSILLLRTAYSKNQGSMLQENYVHHDCSFPFSKDTISRKNPANALKYVNTTLFML
jgi:hypothetical protein